MPRIHTVAQDGLITASDKLIGSDGADNNNHATRNYSIGGITSFVLNGTHPGSFTTIASSGNATIGGNLAVAGTGTFGANVLIINNSTPSIRLQDTNQNSNLIIYAGESEVVMGSISTHPLKFVQNTGTALTIDTSKNAQFVGSVTAISFVGPLTGNVTGNVTGNLTGNVTGNLTGNVIGGTISGTTGTFSGLVTGGTASFGGIDFVDNAKARFGTGNDLEIYHDSTHSYIKETGDGDLRIETTGSVVIKAAVDDTAADLELWADKGDNNSDYWKLTAQTDNVFEIQTKDSGSWEPVIELSASDKRVYFKGSAGIYVPGPIQNSAFKIPNSTGTAGQVLRVPSSGTELEWATAIGVPHIINGLNNANSLSIGYSSWSGNGPQTGDTGARENVAVGIGAMNSILQGDGNVAVGYNANTGLGFGDFNIAIGHKAGASTDSSANNLTTGDRNILIGANAGVTNTGNFNSIVIGTHHDVDSGNGIVALSHQTIIGNDQTNDAIVKGLRQEVRTSPATDTLSDVRGTDANKITVLDSTSAITITLPDHATNSAGNNVELGKTYTFAVKTAATGGAIHKIVCANTSLQKIIGTWVMAGNASFSYESNNYSAINMDGTTKGGGVGTIFSLTCIADGIWLINNAAIIMSGSVTSPFTTS